METARELLSAALSHGGKFEGVSEFLSGKGLYTLLLDSFRDFYMYMNTYTKIPRLSQASLWTCMFQPETTLL